MADINFKNEKIEETFDVIIMGGELKVSQVIAASHDKDQVKSVVVSSYGGADLGKNCGTYERAYGIVEALPAHIAQHAKIVRARKTIVTHVEYTDMVTPNRQKEIDEKRSRLMTEL